MRTSNRVLRGQNWQMNAHSNDWLRTRTARERKKNETPSYLPILKDVKSVFCFQRLHTKQQASSIVINVIFLTQLPKCTLLPHTAPQQQHLTLKPAPLMLMKPEKSATSHLYTYAYRKATMVHELAIIYDVLQFKPTIAHNFIKITLILQNTNSYILRALMAPHQGEHSCAQLCANKARSMYEFVFCNIIVILIKLCAIVGLKCNNWITIHGMENVKYIGLIILNFNSICLASNCFCYCNSSSGSGSRKGWRETEWAGRKVSRGAGWFVQLQGWEKRETG